MIPFHRHILGASNFLEEAIDPAFVMRIDTTKPGSASDTMIIPTNGAGYDCQVEWGDGTTTTHEGTAPSIQHTYAAAGEYDVRITGEFPRVLFNNSGDRLKVLRVHLGDGSQSAVVWGTNLTSAWQGCGNNTEVTGVIPSSVTNLASAWFGNNLSEWTVDIPDGVTTLLAAWFSNNLSEWTVALPSSVTTLQSAWMNNNLSEWTVAIPSSVTTLRSAWFNNNLSEWTVAIPSSVTTLQWAWRNNGNMSIDPTFLNAATDANNYIECFLATTIPTEQYSQLLANLEETNTQNDVPFHGGNSKYNAAGETARNILTTAPRNWTITDGGLET